MFNQQQYDYAQQAAAMWSQYWQQASTMQQQAYGQQMQPQQMQAIQQPPLPQNPPTPQQPPLPRQAQPQPPQSQPQATALSQGPVSYQQPQPQQPADIGQMGWNQAQQPQQQPHPQSNQQQPQPPQHQPQVPPHQPHQPQAPPHQAQPPPHQPQWNQGQHQWNNQQQQQPQQFGQNQYQNAAGAGPKPLMGAKSNNQQPMGNQKHPQQQQQNNWANQNQFSNQDQQWENQGAQWNEHQQHQGQGEWSGNNQQQEWGNNNKQQQQPHGGWGNQQNNNQRNNNNNNKFQNNQSNNNQKNGPPPNQRNQQQQGNNNWIKQQQANQKGNQWKSDNNNQHQQEQNNQHKGPGNQWNGNSNQQNQPGGNQFRGNKNQQNQQQQQQQQGGSQWRSNNTNQQNRQGGNNNQWKGNNNNNNNDNYNQQNKWKNQNQNQPNKWNNNQQQNQQNFNNNRNKNMAINERTSELTYEEASKSFAVGNVLSSTIGGEKKSQYPGPKKDTPIQPKSHNTTFEKQIGPVKPPAPITKKPEHDKHSSSVPETAKTEKTTPEETENSDDSLQALQKQLEMLESQIKNYQTEYQKWHQDFVKWQKEHQNHPDQKQYIDYQKKYQKLIEEQQTQLKGQYSELQKKIVKKKADLKKQEEDKKKEEAMKKKEEAMKKKEEVASVPSSTQEDTKSQGAAKISPIGLISLSKKQEDEKKAAGAAKIAALGLKIAQPQVKKEEHGGARQAGMSKTNLGSVVTSSTVSSTKTSAAALSIRTTTTPTTITNSTTKQPPTLATSASSGSTVNISFSSKDLMNIKALADGLAKSGAGTSAVNSVPKPSTSVIKARPSLQFPGVRCRFFPSCTFGSNCRYEHPVCPKASTCKDPECIYEHPEANCSAAAESRKRDAPLNDTTTISSESRERKLAKLDEEPQFMPRVGKIYESQNRQNEPPLPPSSGVGSDDKHVPSHVIGTSSDPDLDIYERRRREVLSDPLLDPPPHDRFIPPHHPRDPLPPPSRILDPLYPERYERDAYHREPLPPRDRDPLRDPYARNFPPPPPQPRDYALRDPLYRGDPYAPTAREDPSYRREELVRREQDIYGRPVRDPPYDLPPVDYNHSREPALPRTIDYGHGDLPPRSDIGPAPGELRDRYPPNDRDRERDPKRDDRSRDSRRYNDRDSRDREPSKYRDGERPRRLDDSGRDSRPRRDDSRERHRDDRYSSRDRYSRDRSDRGDRRDDDRYRSSSRRSGTTSTTIDSSKPSDFLRRIEERERERSQRDSFRDYEMLYASNSPTRGGASGTGVGGASSSKIPDDELKPEVVSAIDLFDNPGRNNRPKNIVIILRGIPGAGKSYVAKIIKEKESHHGGNAPRILALDDYFMNEKQEYMFESDMEEPYRSSLLKAFNKTLADGFFPMVIVDAINHKTKHFDQFWSDAKHKGFEVYIAELQGDLNQCFERSLHQRPKIDVEEMLDKWERAPVYYKRLDVSGLLQQLSIDDVEMEDYEEPAATEEGKEGEGGEKEEEEDEELPDAFHIPKSKWESSKEETLAKLDGFNRKKDELKKGLVADDIDDEEDDPYGEKEADMRLGKKRVRWKDLEDKKQIDHQRKIGFTIGMDWNILTNPDAQIPM